MALVYRIDFRDGVPRVWLSGHVLTANGYHFGTDPYAGEDSTNVITAEAVKITPGVGPDGGPVLETDTSEGETESVAGIIVAHLRLPLNRFTVKAAYRMTASAIADGLPFAPLYWLATMAFSVDAELDADIQGSNVRMTLSYRTSDGYQSEQSYSRPTASISQDLFEVFTIKGRNGTYTGTGDRTADGYIQAFIDSTTIYDIQNISLDLGSGTAASESDREQAIFTQLGIGSSGLYGQIGYLEIYDDDGVDTSASLGGCCATAKAPGGGEIIPSGTVDPIGPRDNSTVGTFSYTPVAGGGTLAAASDPTDAQTLDSAVDPYIHLELITADAATQRWGAQAANAGTTNPPVTAKVLSYSELPSEILADHRGAIPSQGWTVTVDDTARTVRGWMAGANRYFLNRWAKFLIENYSQRALDTAARKLTAGYVTGMSFLDKFSVELEFANLLTAVRSPLSLTKKIPKRLYTKTMFPGAPEDTWGRPVPIYYGEISDDYDWSLDNSRKPVGIVPVVDLGFAKDIDIANALQGFSDGTQWRAAGVCGHAVPVGAIQSTFLWSGQHDADGNAIRNRLRWEPGYAGGTIVDWANPEESQWSAIYMQNRYVRVRGTDGSLEDHTILFYRGPRAYEWFTGQIPISINLAAGVEDVGDGTGDSITNAAHQLAHLICYWILGDYRYGTWGSLPAFPDSTTMLNRGSVDTVADILDARLPNSYRGSIAIGVNGDDLRTGEDLLTDLQVGMNIRLGLNHHSQIFLNTFNSLASVASLTTFTDASIRNFRVILGVDEFDNVNRFDYGQEPATGRVSGTLQELVDSDSITNWGERREGDQWTNVATRYLDMATDVGRRQLARTANVPVTGTFETDLRGTSVRAGQLIRLTSEEGLDSTGWTDRVLEVRAVIPLVNEGELLTRIEWEDVHERLEVTALQQSIFTVGGLSTGPFWGQPIGATGDGTAQPLGSTVSGTARRLM